MPRHGSKPAMKRAGGPRGRNANPCVRVTTGFSGERLAMPWQRGRRFFPDRLGWPGRLGNACCCASEGSGRVGSVVASAFVCLWEGGKVLRGGQALVSVGF